MGDFLGSLTGSGQRDAIGRGTGFLREAGQQGIGEIRGAEERALGFLSPFSQLGQSGIDQAGFLTDQQAQFDFLQNNPLFQLALNNANQGTNAAAAAGGRLSAGDTLQQLSNNVLLSASPLIDRQSGGIRDLLNIGTGVAGQQAGISTDTGTNIANLLGEIGSAEASGAIASKNARDRGSSNLLGLAGGIASIFSDPKLKENKRKIGKKNGFSIWSWTWTKEAFKKFNLKGNSTGVMLPEVIEKMPEAVSYQNGFGKVNYSMIGIIPEFS
jgi:hypothetical protein